jgi:NADH-quinone oxidoreductase subunit A
VVFLLPWTLIYREFLAWKLPVLLPALSFIGLLVLGLLYEVRKGALDWER